MVDVTPATVAPAARPAYIIRLDGVRAASILLVVLAHTFPIGLPDWQFNSVFGRTGMALFFCLSGYLITSMLYADQRIVPFLVKRVTRIVPAMFLYLTFLVIFFDLPVRLALLNITFLSNYATEGLIAHKTGHLWSLCVEMHFYIAISLVVAIGGQRALWLVFPAALVITGLRIDAGVIANINTHLRADEILVGGWLALLSYHYGDRFKVWLAPPARAMVIISVLILLFMISGHDKGQPLTYFRPYFAMLLVGAIMHCNVRWLIDLLEARVSRYIGKISYALYIWHPIMIFGWMNTGSTVERYVMKRPVSWALSWFAAHVSTIYWEARFQKGARRYLKDRGY